MTRPSTDVVSTSMVLKRKKHMKSDLIETISNADNLYHAINRLHKASGWKEATQKLELNKLFEICDLQDKIRNNSYEQGDCSEFKICEQGHLRLIKALKPRDMMLQHSLCDNVLIPILQRYLIHDNGASQKGKGISFTRKRFEQHIHQFYRKHGRDGYVLKIDFRKYFDNIQHDKMIEAVRKKIQDEDFLMFLKSLIDAYKIDVSYSDDPNIIDKVFNSLEYQEISREKKTGKRYMGKSLGIGAPISQILGIYFPNRIDTYIKTVKSCKYYDAYMDDRIILHQDKEYLKRLLNEIRDIAIDLGIHINEKKTQIIKMSHGFTFLKTRYILTDTGKLIRKIPRDTIVRQRRKMKHLAKLVAKGERSLETFTMQYQSWVGDKKRYHAYHTLQNMNSLYEELLRWIIQNKKISREAAGNHQPEKRSHELCFSCR